MKQSHKKGAREQPIHIFSTCIQDLLSQFSQEKPRSRALPTKDVITKRNRTLETRHFRYSRKQAISVRKLLDIPRSDMLRKTSEPLVQWSESPFIAQFYEFITGGLLTHLAKTQPDLYSKIQFHVFSFGLSQHDLSSECSIWEVENRLARMMGKWVDSISHTITKWLTGRQTQPIYRCSTLLTLQVTYFSKRAGDYRHLTTTGHQLVIGLDIDTGCSTIAVWLIDNNKPTDYVTGNMHTQLLNAMQTALRKNKSLDTLSDYAWKQISLHNGISNNNERFSCVYLAHHALLGTSFLENMQEYFSPPNNITLWNSVQTLMEHHLLAMRRWIVTQEPLVSGTSLLFPPQIAFMGQLNVYELDGTYNKLYMQQGNAASPVNSDSDEEDDVIRESTEEERKNEHIFLGKGYKCEMEPTSPLSYDDKEDDVSSCSSSCCSQEFLDDCFAFELGKEGFTKWPS